MMLFSVSTGDNGALERQGVFIEIQTAFEADAERAGRAPVAEGQSAAILIGDFAAQPIEGQPLARQQIDKAGQRHRIDQPRDNRGIDHAEILHVERAFGQPGPLAALIGGVQCQGATAHAAGDPTPQKGGPGIGGVNMQIDPLVPS